MIVQSSTTSHHVANFAYATVKRIIQIFFQTKVSISAVPGLEPSSFGIEPGSWKQVLLLYQLSYSEALDFKLTITQSNTVSSKCLSLWSFFVFVFFCVFLCQSMLLVPWLYYPPARKPVGRQQIFSWAKTHIPPNMGLLFINIPLTCPRITREVTAPPVPVRRDWRHPLGNYPDLHNLEGVQNLHHKFQL